MSFFSELKRRNVVRIAIAYVVLTWLVLQVSDVLTETLELPLTLGKSLLALMAIGFIPTLLFSWVYELTPEGLKREKDISPAESITDHTAKRLDIAVIILLLAAMGLFAVDRFSAPRETPTVAGETVRTSADEQPSIAVLPFLNLSNDPDNEYFSDGLTETLLHMLAQVQDIRVAARSSAFAFKGTNTDVRQIAAELNVATVLEGSVQRAGDRVRVTAQLIDADTGSQIWSQNFDRTIDDIFAIQDEIANSVAAAMTVSLLGDNGNSINGDVPRIDTMSTRSTEAYEFYLRGLGPRAEGSHQSLPVAETAFTEALLIDPNFREARMALVSTYIFMGETALIPRDESISKTRAALAPLLAAGSNDPLVEGVALFMDFMDERSERFVTNEAGAAYYDRLVETIERAPNEPLLYVAGAEILDGITGRAEEQLALIERGLRVDPYNVDLLVWKGRVLSARLRRVDDAFAAYARLREVAPNNPNGHAMPALIHEARGDYAKAFQGQAQAAQIDRRDHELVAFAAVNLMDTGLYEQAQPWIRRAELLDADGAATQSAKLMYLYFTSRHDAALALAEKVLREKKNNRRGVYSVAAAVYTSEMLRRERTEEVFELFDQIAPGSASDPAYEAQDDFGITLFINAQLIRPGGLTDVEIEAWREVNQGLLEDFAPDWREDDSFIEMRYMYGYDSLEDSARNLAAHIVEDHAFRSYDRLSHPRPATESLYSHPDVVAAIQVAAAHNDAEAQLILEMIENGEVPEA